MQEINTSFNKNLKPIFEKNCLFDIHTYNYKYDEGIYKHEIIRYADPIIELLKTISEAPQENF